MKTKNKNTPTATVKPNVSRFTPSELPVLDLRIVRETRTGIFAALRDWLRANDAPAHVIDAMHQLDYLSYVASTADANYGLVSRDVNSSLAIEVRKTMKLSKRLTRGMK